MLAWAVLTGLFFMHGAPSSAGCPDGAPMAQFTATATAVLPAAAPGAAVAVTDLLTAARPPATSATASARQSPVPAPPALRATADKHGGSCCDGLCSSRQPRQGSGGALAGPAAAISLPAAAALPVRYPAVAHRSGRPPGRPGMPLPLFLGVSRT